MYSKAIICGVLTAGLAQHVFGIPTAMWPGAAQRKIYRRQNVTAALSEGTVLSSTDGSVNGSSMLNATAMSPTTMVTSSAPVVAGATVNIAADQPDITIPLLNQVNDVQAMGAAFQQTAENLSSNVDSLYLVSKYMTQLLNQVRNAGPEPTLPVPPDLSALPPPLTSIDHFPAVFNVINNLLINCKNSLGLLFTALQTFSLDVSQPLQNGNSINGKTPQDCNLAPINSGSKSLTDVLQKLTLSFPLLDGLIQAQKFIATMSGTLGQMHDNLATLENQSQQIGSIMTPVIGKINGSCIAPVLDSLTGLQDQVSSLSSGINDAISTVGGTLQQVSGAISNITDPAALTNLTDATGALGNLTSGTPDLTNLTSAVPHFTNLTSGVPELTGVPDLTNLTSGVPEITNLTSDLPNLTGTPDLSNVTSGLPALTNISGVPGVITSLTGTPDVTNTTVTITSGNASTVISTAPLFESAADAIDGLQNLSSTLPGPLGALAGALSQLTQLLGPNLSSGALGLLNQIGGYLTTLGNPLSNITGGLGNLTNLTSGLGNLTDLAGGLDSLRDGLPDPSNLTGGLSNLTNITSGLEDLSNATEALGNVSGAAGGLNNITDSLSNVTDAVQTAVTNLGNTVDATLTGVTGTVTGTLAGLNNAVNVTLDDLGTAVSDTLSNVGNTVTGTVQGLSSTLNDTVTGVGNSLGGLTGALTGGAVNPSTIAPVTQAATVPLADASSAVANATKTADSISGTLKNASSSLTGALNTASNALTAALKPSSAKTSGLLGGHRVRFRT